MDDIISAPRRAVLSSSPHAPIHTFALVTSVGPTLVSPGTSDSNDPASFHQKGPHLFGFWIHNLHWSHEEVLMHMNRAPASRRLRPLRFNTWGAPPSRTDGAFGTKRKSRGPVGCSSSGDQNFSVFELETSPSSSSAVMQTCACFNSLF